MKILSLDEIDLLDFQVPGESYESAMRLKHTAREYHRLREALEIIKSGGCFSPECDWVYSYDRYVRKRHGIEPHPPQIAREVLKESEKK